MKTEFRVFALGEKTSDLKEIKLGGLTPIGGSGTSGFVLEGLKHKGDYAILAPQGDALALHPLRGKQNQPLTIRAGETARLEDLTLIVVKTDEVKKPHADASAGDSSRLASVLKSMSQTRGAEKPLEEVLNHVMQLAHHEKGLVISRSLKGSFEILVSKNIDASDAWLSESLVLTALKDRKPLLLQNVVGTDFDSKASIVATGFISVFCWPLLSQGEVLGLFVTGSKRPHSGLTEEDKTRIGSFVHLGALVTHFRLQELSLRSAEEKLKARAGDSSFLTTHPRLKETIELARKIAPSDLAVLVQGETGVGKEVLSRWIHEKSDRKGKPFIAVNCSAIPNELLESVLFGHKKGSFTGAHSDQIGKIQQADGGTLFLDEIGDLPLSLQAKFLRVLQDKCVEPVGSTRAVQVDVRFISATHKNVKELVSQGKFREDLYYRLAEITLWIPPLRERPGDIRLLAAQILSEVAPQKRMSDEAWGWLLSQPWRGNVREMKGAIKRAALLSSGDSIAKEGFLYGSESHSVGAATWVSAEKSWLGAENLEKAKHLFVWQKIQQALELTAGNRTKAAELLGVTPRTLFRYLEQEGVKEMSDTV